MRSASGNSSSLLTSCSNTSSTPSSWQRSCRMFSIFLRPMPTKPWPLVRILRPLKTSSMSSQWLKAHPRWSPAVSGSHCAHRLHRRVGEDDAPAERVVRPVALDHRDLMRRVLLLHQEGEIEAGRAAADTDNAHLPFSGWFNPSARASESPTPNVSTEWTQSNKISSLKGFLD